MYTQSALMSISLLCASLDLLIRLFVPYDMSVLAVASQWHDYVPTHGNIAVQ